MDEWQKCKCKCKETEGQEPHACPYQEDVNNNPDPTYCTCCEECQYQCAMDI